MASECVEGRDLDGVARDELSAMLLQVEHAPPDPRLPVLGNFVQKTLKLKAEKWTRLLATEDLRKCVLDFLDKPDSMTLIVMQVSQRTGPSAGVIVEG